MRFLLFIFSLLPVARLFAQTTHVEARLEIDLKKHLIIGRANDSTDFYPTPTQIAGTLNSVEFITDCLSRFRKYLKPEDKKAFMARIKGKLHEEGDWLDISFSDSDAGFAKQFMDTLIYQLQMQQIQRVFAKFRERESLLDALLTNARDMQKQYDEVYRAWVDEKRLNNYECERALLQNKLRQLDSLYSMDKRSAEGLNRMEDRILKEDMFYANIPGLYLGYHDAGLQKLYMQAVAVQKDSSQKADFDSIRKEILVYIKDLRKTFADRIDMKRREIRETENHVGRLLKLEDEYEQMKARKVKYKKRVDVLEEQLEDLKMKRVSVTPFTKIVIAPHVVE